MKKHAKKFLSAIVTAAMCAASVPLNTANAQIVIDHDTSGIDKGFYYEIECNNEGKYPDFLLQPRSDYECRWTDKDDFSAARGLKFASPVEYSKLGDISYKYWRSIRVGSSDDDKKGSVRFGIRLHNSKGDVIDILETDLSADGSSITENGGEYTKLGSLDSKEIMNDYVLGEKVAGDSYDVAYTIYSCENADKKTNKIICRRDKSLTVNNETEEQRRISVSDKLEAIAAAGVEIGEITDIGLFLESSELNGEALIYTFDISIENMPEIAADKSEDDEAPIIVKGNDYGVRTGYYYGTYSRAENEKMEVTAPSLFKAEWHDAANTNEQYFERGKQYEKGQSYKALSGSSIEYTINFEDSGKYIVNTVARMNGSELPKYYVNTEVHIIDACSLWGPSEYARKIGSLKAEGVEYNVYDDTYSVIGTGKARLMQRYYFVNVIEAEKNGKNETVTVKHDLEPFIKFLHDNDIMLGEPDTLVAQYCMGNTEGTAELVKNEVILPDYIPDDGEYERYTRRIELNGMKSDDVYLKGTGYFADGQNLTMEGYAGERIDCVWRKDAFRDQCRSFSIGKKFLAEQPRKEGTKADKDFLIDYNVDMGEIIPDNENSNWVLGGYIRCMHEKAYSDFTDILDGEYSFVDILVADVSGDKVGNEFSSCFGEIGEPEKLGTVESRGVKYDVSISLPKVKGDGYPFVLLTRQEEFKPVEADDIPVGYTRYENTIDATDIVKMINELGVKTGSINNVMFDLTVRNNNGSAVIYDAGVREVPSKDTVYTEEDVKKHRDYILGNEADIGREAEYDLNGDGVWDCFDLSVMRKMTAEQ